MKNNAVYPGTFDPITLGHIDLIERASQLFDKVIVAIASNPNKKPLFSLEERVALAKQVLGSFPSVEVHGFDNLLLDFAQAHHVNIILRGLRAVADFDYEFQLAGMNRHLRPDIETLFLMPAEKYLYLSSSLIREVATLGGDITGFVPDVIVQAIHKKLGR